MFGDLRDRSSLDRACRGADVVISTVSVTKTGDDSIERVDLQGNLDLIAAAHVASVGHFAFVSTVGASAESPVPIFRAKAAVEQQLRQSGLAFTILQPNAFMDVWFPMLIESAAFSGRPITLVGESRRRHSFVAEQDVAAFAVAAVRNPPAHNAAIVIGGPDALTLRDVVGAYEDAANRTFAIQSVPPGAPIPGVPEVVWGLAAALETYDTPIPMEETSRQFGVTLTSARDFARSRVAAHTASTGTRFG
jgi:NADH dehydrogenase